ncbi:MAG: DUF3868 domain-containing protein [Phocaeicola sp.]
MKKTVLFVILMTSCLIGKAQISSISMNRIDVHVENGGDLLLSMDIELPSNVKVSSNEILQLTPFIQTEDKSNSSLMPTLVVSGKKRRIVEERKRSKSLLTEQSYLRKNKTVQTFHYLARIPYESWMVGGDIKLLLELTKCKHCANIDEKNIVESWRPTQYQVRPNIVFIRPPKDSIKLRAEVGKAYLDFPVNQTIIKPNYRNNPRELATIKRTMDIFQNPLVTITDISITGYASPEGNYMLNGRLSKGRAEALKGHLIESYFIAPSMIQIHSVAEDWEGLEAYVVERNGDYAKELLQIIQKESIEFDQKDELLKHVGNGTPYKELLTNCYPTLRRSDYTVNYVVADFTPQESTEIIDVNPKLLSQNELYQLAHTFQPGSTEFYYPFEVAVELYPTDPIANLNAAAVELQRGNLDKALQHLEKSDPQAAATLNNKGVAHLLKENLDLAERLFQESIKAGGIEAKENLIELDKKRNEELFYGTH